MLNPKQKLLIAAVMTLALAVFQAVITISPEWSLYFGAGEYVTSRIWLLYLTGFLAAIIFAIFGLYPLSAIGYIRKLPLLRFGLVTICVVFLLRGIFLFLELIIYFNLVPSNAIIYPREIVSSAISFIIGLFYLSGIVGYWSNIPGKK